MALAIGCFVGGWICGTCSAVELTFTLDPAASQVTASALIVPVEGPMSPQAPGSTVAGYSGTIVLEVDDPLDPSSLQFLGGSVAAATTGDWLPEIGGGSPGSFLPGDADPGTPEPANYGLTASQLGLGTLWLAFRDLVLSPTSEPLPVAENTFAAEQTISLTSGSADYAARSVFFGDRNATEQLAGEQIENASEGTGSYSVENGRATLQLPIELFDTFTDESTGFALLELNFSGSITATAIFDASPSADVDGDGDVDGHDLLDMLLGFGTVGGATRSDGDADLDGDVDRADVQVWREQVGTGIGPAAVATAVPEPHGITVGLLLGGLLLFVRWRRSRTRL
jgi:hypothetical protein